MHRKRLWGREFYRKHKETKNITLKDTRVEGIIMLKLILRKWGVFSDFIQHRAFCFWNTELLLSIIMPEYQSHCIQELGVYSSRCFIQLSNTSDCVQGRVRWKRVVFKYKQTKCSLAVAATGPQSLHSACESWSICRTEVSVYSRDTRAEIVSISFVRYPLNLPSARLMTN
jgi:hypothetical protein